jgi:hypothetical protein
VKKKIYEIIFLTLSVLGHMAAIVLRPFSGNFTSAGPYGSHSAEAFFRKFH